MTAASPGPAPVTPGQAAYEAFYAGTECGVPVPWAELTDWNEHWNAAAQAAIGAAEDWTTMLIQRDEARAERDRLAAALRYLAPPDGHWLTCIDDGRLDLRQEVLAMRAHARAALEGGQ